MQINCLNVYVYFQYINNIEDKKNFTWLYNIIDRCVRKIYFHIKIFLQENICTVAISHGKWCIFVIILAYAQCTLLK